MEFTPGKPLRTFNDKGEWQDFSTDEFIGQKRNYFKGWHCSMGVNNLFINADGHIYGASCYEKGILGNVWEDFQLSQEWHHCQKVICSCGGDLFVPKVKELSQIDLLVGTNKREIDIEKKTSDIGDVIGMERVWGPESKQVHWEIGRRCNYSCSYCWPDLHSMHEKHKSFEQLLEATKRIQEQFIKGGNCNFIITGGEPTTNAALPDWLLYLKSFGYHISLHSNGSRTPEYYAKLVHLADLNLSVHFEAYDRKKFVKVVEEVTRVKKEADNKGIGHFEVKIMMAPNNLEETKSLEQEILAIDGFKGYCMLSISSIKNNDEIFLPDGTRMDGMLLPGYTKEHESMFGDRCG